jgi:hypothetical protein
MMATDLLNVVVWNQTLWLVFFIRHGLLLCFPPIIIRVVVQNKKQVPLGYGQFALALGHIVVDGPVYTEERHGV